MNDDKLVNGDIEELVKEIYFALFGKPGDRSKIGIYTQVGQINDVLQGDHRRKGLILEVAEISEFVARVKIGWSLIKGLAVFFGLSSIASLLSLAKLLGWIK